MCRVKSQACLANMSTLTISWWISRISVNFFVYHDIAPKYSQTQPVGSKMIGISKSSQIYSNLGDRSHPICASETDDLFITPSMYLHPT